MNMGILGTGMVGNAIGSRLISLGHKVKMGSRTAGNDKAKAWVAKNGSSASEDTFAGAAKFGEIIFNCTSGKASLEALKSAGALNLKYTHHPTNRNPAGAAGLRVRYIRA